MAVKETKQGTTPMIGVTLEGVDEKKGVASVEFIFKQKKKGAAEALVHKIYAGTTGDSVVFENGNYYFSFAEAESRLFREEQLYYMDTRIVYTDGSIPQTDIVEFYSLTTLFEEVV